MSFQRGPGEGYMAAKNLVLALCPTAVCRRRFHGSGSVRGYVVYRTRGGATALAFGGSARDAWNRALTRLDAKRGSK